MQGDVFGLNRLYELQVQNKEGTDTFQSSPVNYGYYAGGTLINLYSRLDFSNESISVISGNFSSGTLFDARFNKMLAITRGNLTSAYTPNYGYVIGGITSPTTYTNTIERFQFSTETNSLTASARLNQEKGQAATVFNDNYAYVCGGFSPLVTSCTIDRLEFGTETISSPGKNLPTTKYIFSGVPSPSTNYGYLSSGFFPTDICTITRLDFTTETAVNSGKSMAPARWGPGSVFNSQFGYWGGGYTTAPAIAFHCTINRIEFSTETITTSPANLSQARYRLSGLQGSQNGYYAAGQVAGPGLSCRIDRLNFSTETASSSVSTYLSIAIQGLTGFSASTQRKVTRNYFSEDKLYGFVVGGTVDPGAVATCRIDRLDYSNETISSPGQNLTSNRDSYGNASSNQYGYFGAGLFRGAAVPTLSLFTTSIDRIEYSTETVKNLSSALTSQRQDLSGTHSDNYGYFAGGVIPGPVTYSTIDRIDFSTETVSLPGKSLTFIKRSTSTGSVRSEYYGYIAGGRDPGAIYYSNINKIDFTTEVVSDTTSFLAAGRSALGGVPTNSYAYWAAGASPGTYCLIDRLEFSTDTVNAAGNLTSQRASTTAISNFSFGYWCGGSIAGRVSTLERVDFYNGTASTPTSRLSVARSALGSVSGGSGGSSRIGKSLTKIATQYGYYGGGYSITPPVRICTISRLDLTTETSNNISNQLTEARTLMGSVSSNTFGYYLGGDNATPVRVCTIDRLDFSTEVVSAPATRLLAARAGLSAVKSSNSDLGYFGGGLDATTYNCSINRIDFSTESIVNISKFLLTNGAYAAYSQNSLYGFFAGGIVPTPVISCRIDRLDFGTETFSTVPVGMPQARFHMAATQTGQYGYFAGGDAPGAVNTITRLDFINNTISTPANTLKTTRRSNVGTSSLLYGYYAGGSTPPNVYLSTIDRLDFGTETVRTSSNFMSNSTDLPTSLTASAKTISRYTTTTGTYGYFGGGYFAPAAVCTIDRIDFSTETVSAPAKNLTQARRYLSAVSNASYGYFGGGQPSSNLASFCTIDRLDFSNETISLPGKSLTQARNRLSAVSSASYGYFGGGYFSGPTFTNTIDRIDFSNETTSLPGKNLTQARSALAAVSNSSYGYFGGGYFSPVGTYYNTIDRLDFSNETTSLPGKNLLELRGYLAAPSSASYGYFGGGYGGSFLSTINRLDFSTETISLPGKNLTQARFNLAATSSTSYGYFGGGFATGGQVNTIDRLDFFTETVSAPGKNLIESRFGLAAVSTEQRASTGQKGFQSFTATYGYFAGFQTPGAPPLVSCIVDRIDFSNETTSVPGKNLTQGRGGAATVSSSSYGYFGGGADAAGVDISTIDRIDFSTETLSSPKRNLVKRRTYHGAVSSSSYGYFGGGLSVGSESSLERLDFSNETTTALKNNLPEIKFRSAGTQSPLYGYFTGGAQFAVPPPARSTVNRLDFSTETTSAPGINLPNDRTEHSVSESDSYAYLGGGFFPIAPNTSSPSSTIDRLDFSTEIVTRLRNNFPISRTSAATVSTSSYGYYGSGQNASVTISRISFLTETTSNISGNLSVSGPYGTAVSSSYKPPIRNGWGWRKTYGYFAGGAVSALPPEVCTIDRLDFSNETVSLPGNNLTFARQGGFGAVSNNLYGYFGSGADSSIFNRLDFNTELVSGGIFGKSPLGNRGSISAVSSTSYGYFVGFSGPGPLSSTERLDFSTELTSFPSLPTGQLQRSGMCGVFTISYGYFAGGADPTPATVCSIDRLDFSTEIISSPGTYQLSRKRRSISSAANGSYGYFAQGSDPGVSIIVSNFDRLDFSNETTKVLTPFVSSAHACGETYSASYAYFGGGFATFRSTIDRLDFSTETSSTINSKLTQGRDSLDGIQAN